MNYSKIYSDFIADRREKESALSGYSEKHHIVPRSLGGNNKNENIITLEIEDHIHAHILLAKIHGGKMWAAVMFIFGNQKLQRRIPTRKEIKVSTFARMMNAKMQTGKLGNFYGKKHSSEYIKSITGLSHFNADHTVYNFEHIDGRKDRLTRIEFSKKHKIPKKSLMPLFQKYKYPVHGWFIPETMDKSKFGHLKGNAHPQADTKNYCFQNKSGETFTGTRHDLRDRTGVTEFTVSKLILGTRKTCGGWFIV